MSAESWWTHCWVPVVRQVCGMHEFNAGHLSKDTQVQRRGDTGSMWLAAQQGSNLKSTLCSLARCLPGG